MESPVRKLPYDEDAEKAILGLMLIDKTAIGIAEEMLRADDFYIPKHQKLFKVITNLSSRGENVDPVLVNSEINKELENPDPNSLDYIIQLTVDAGLVSNAKAYCKIIDDKSTLRALIEMADKISQAAYEDKEKTEDIVELAEKGIFDITQKSNNEGLTRIDQSLIETIDMMQMMATNNGDITGVTTGLIDLDRQLSGLQNSELILLAARPSMGKTALGVNMAVSAAIKNKVVAIFSLEMGKIQLVQRIMSSLSLVNLSNIISGKIDNWSMITNAVTVMEKMPLYIDDTPSISLTELRAKARRLKAEVGLDMILIDYLQLMTIKGHSENRQLEISSISRGLKALSKELKCPILALAQLSRAPELRTNKRPILSDLRESGAIEQDADVVMMLYRDDYYNEDSEAPNTAEVIITKHRNGATGTVNLFYHKEITKFSNLDQNYGS